MTLNGLTNEHAASLDYISLSNSIHKLEFATQYSP